MFFIDVFFINGNCVYGDKGRGSKKLENWGYVIYEWPLASVHRPCQDQKHWDTNTHWGFYDLYHQNISFKACIHENKKECLIRQYEVLQMFSLWNNFKEDNINSKFECEFVYICMLEVRSIQ